MEDKRYAPPKSDVEGQTAEDLSPPLWNPNAAAVWSLLFTPIFGIWLHMFNWRALGETERAESAKTWLMLTALLIVGTLIGGVLMPFSGLLSVSRFGSFGLLLAWYFASARPQARWVAERYGNRYRRRGWGQPLLGAVILIIGGSVGFGLLMTFFYVLFKG